MNVVRVCVGEEAVSKSQGTTGEMIAIMCWECMVHQVDVMARDANKACYYLFPGEQALDTYVWQLSHAVLDPEYGKHIFTSLEEGIH